MIDFDPVNKRIVLDSPFVTASQIWSRWIDWVSTGDNAKWTAALQQVGGDDLGSSLAIPLYFFLLNGWRVRPMEANHTLVITGNLFVDGGGVPVVPTLGNYNVSVQYTVPVQAQTVQLSGGGGGSTITEQQMEQIAAAVWNKQVSQHTGVGSFGKLMQMVLTFKQFLGLK